MEIDFSFINEPTREFFYCTKRNSCISGGYGSGKTYVACMKILFLLLSFKKYRAVIGRKELKALRETTLKTFTKICPERLYTYNSIEGKMTFLNGSEALWMHLDNANERTLRGLEVNSVFLDQPEELEEQVYTTLNARIGRWDQAEPTQETLSKNGYKSLRDWPRDSKTGNFLIPSYMMLAPNPDNEEHWIWRKYHPDSPEFPKNKNTHAYFEVSSRDNPKLPPETLEIMLANDPVWVQRFVDGKWGISEATIHVVLPQSRINASKVWIENFLQKSRLYLVLDHGESAPTCALWVAAHKNVFLVYREYYMPGKVISFHRKQIAALTGDEPISQYWADPAIFKKTTQKYGGHWSVAEEYADSALEDDDPDAKPIYFQPADNTELSTRNRINELLTLRKGQIHPFTGEDISPRLFFLDKNPAEHNYGVEKVLIQTRIQRRVKLSEINGRPIFSDEREPSVDDHAYDCLRYFVAMHAASKVDDPRHASPRSFLSVRRQAKANKLYRGY